MLFCKDVTFWQAVDISHKSNVVIWLESLNHVSYWRGSIAGHADCVKSYVSGRISYSFIFLCVCFDLWPYKTDKALCALVCLSLEKDLKSSFYY